LICFVRIGDRRSKTGYRCYDDRQDHHKEDKGRSDRKEEPTPKESNPSTGRPPLKGTINTISGGFVGGGATSSINKHHLRSIQSTNVITCAFR